jgi:hypothetical protein
MFLYLGLKNHQDRASPAVVDATIVLVSVAPDVRAISRSSCISKSVGMPLIPSREETEGAMSAFSFGKRTVGSSSCAARSNIGGMER